MFLKYRKILLALSIVSAIIIIVLISMSTTEKEIVHVKKYVPHIIPEDMSVQTKKERYFYIVKPAIDKVYAELMEQYIAIEKNIHNEKKAREIEELKEFYQVKTDENLLKALKPHPKSIALAQAALESSWATSRFFVKANNIFGMWSVDPDEPRIAANEKRNGIKTIWLRKFSSVEESVREYYALMGRANAYKEFRALKMQTDNPHKLVKKLDNYAEIGAEYGKELSQVIRYNKLQKYD